MTDKLIDEQALLLAYEAMSGLPISPRENGIIALRKGISTYIDNAYKDSIND